MFRLPLFRGAASCLCEKVVRCGLTPVSKRNQRNQPNLTPLVIMVSVTSCLSAGFKKWKLQRRKVCEGLCVRECGMKNLSSFFCIFYCRASDTGRKLRKWKMHLVNSTFISYAKPSCLPHFSWSSDDVVISRREKPYSATAKLINSLKNALSPSHSVRWNRLLCSISFFSSFLWLPLPFIKIIPPSLSFPVPPEFICIVQVQGLNVNKHVWLSLVLNKIMGLLRRPITKPAFVLCDEETLRWIQYL